MTDLDPDRAERLLRAKAAELEGYVRQHSDEDDPLAWLAADIALIAELLADVVHRTRHTNG